MVGNSGSAALRVSARWRFSFTRPLLGVRDRRGRPVEEELHRPAEMILHGVAASLVGNVHQIYSGELLEQLAVEMGG